MSIIIIAFPSAPTVDPEAKRKDEELDSLLRQKVEGDEVPTFISKHFTCKLNTYGSHLLNLQIL